MANVYDTQRVLFINKDLIFLNKIKEQLKDEFDIIFAVTREEAFNSLENNGPFAVIVSDVEIIMEDQQKLLLELSEIVPDSVKVIVSDLKCPNSILDIINKNSIFCFIKKDISINELVDVINDAIREYHLAILEQKLNKKLREEIQEKDKLHQELRRSNEELKRFAFEDELTGLANRRYTQDIALREIERSRRYGDRLSFMMMDLDHFKRINDKYGHIIGDDVLREFSSVLKQNIRLTDIAGRFGGEEFLIILPETDLHNAKSVAEKLREEIAKISFKNFDLDISCSIGVAEINITQESLIDIVKRVDKALYEAKNKGRNRVEVSEYRECIA